MSDLETKLNQVLSSPEAMGQIMSLAQSLGLGGASAPAADAVPAPEPPAASGAAAPALDLQSLLGGSGAFGESGSPISPQLTGLLMRVLSAWNQPNDEKAALLYALRPFLSQKRQEKIERAVQITKISHAIRVALDALKGGNETGGDEKGGNGFV